MSSVVHDCALKVSAKLTRVARRGSWAGLLVVAATACGSNDDTDSSSGSSSSVMTTASPGVTDSASTFPSDTAVTNPGTTGASSTEEPGASAMPGGSNPGSGGDAEDSMGSMTGGPSASPTSTATMAQPDDPSPSTSADDMGNPTDIGNPDVEDPDVDDPTLDDTSDADDSASSGTDDPGSEEPEPPAVPLPFGLVELWPAPGSSNVCPDPQLRLRFSEPPNLGNTGAFHIYDASDPTTPVASVDLASATQRRSDGLNVPRPAWLEGREIIVSFDAAQLGYGRELYVALQGPAVTGPDGASVSFGEDQMWSFSTRDMPAANVDTLSVSPDGSGDFCSVQAALDAAQSGSTIEIASGSYPGVLRIDGKNDLTLRGAGAEQTHLFGINNESMNGGTRARPLILGEGLQGLTIEHLSITNRTPQGGSQAEALALLDCDQCKISHTVISSLQDTLLWSGRVYANDSLIIGNVDYIWGTGTAFFERCEVRTVGRNGYILQSRNTGQTNGYVFVDSKLTADPGITGDILARIEVDRFPDSQVAFIDCEMGPHISREGWLTTGYGDSSRLRFWEYQSRTPDGALVDVSGRNSASRQLSEQEANALRDPAQVLGGWQP